MGLHFMRHDSLVINTTYRLIHFPHLIIQVKSASSETSVRPQVVLAHDSITVSPMTTKKSQFLLTIHREGIQQAL